MGSFRSSVGATTATALLREVVFKANGLWEICGNLTAGKWWAGEAVRVPAHIKPIVAPEIVDSADDEVILSADVHHP